MLVANYPTKKALKSMIGHTLNYTETSIFGAEFKPDGKFCVVGPSAYDRKWYAEVTMQNGRISRVK